MVVDQKLLKSQMMKNHIGSNVLNKISGEQATTQQTTPITNNIQTTTPTTNDTYKVITTKFPTYDIKDLMGFSPTNQRNQISLLQNTAQYNNIQQQAQNNTNPNIRYDIQQPQITNKQTLQIQQATPETNEQGLKINRTASFKDLVVDLQNVANQGRNLEFVKFRELYPEYVENWDKVVDLFESIKSNPQNSAEQVTNTAQKLYPELFGIDDNYSSNDKMTALQKLYDEMISNKKNGIMLTQQDIIDRYPEYANTEDINTVMEVQNLMNRDRKNTPTFNDIYENFESLTKGDTEIGNTEKSTMKKDIDKINNMSQSTYDHLSEEGKKYVQYLATAKEIADYVKEQYYTKASDIEIVENLKNNNPDLYNEIFGDMDIQANLSEEDRKLLDEGYTIGAGKSRWTETKHSATEKLAGLGRKLQSWAGTEWKGERNPQPVNGQREDGTYERNPLMREDGTLETNPIKIREIKMAGNNYQQRVRMQEYRGKNPGMDKIDYKIGEFLFELGEEIQNVGEKGMEKIESSQERKDIAELNKTKFWDALKKGDVKTMLSKSTAALGQSTIDMGLGALTGDPLLAFGSIYAGSYERAMQDIESDENLKGMTQEEKERAARLMAGVESVIEEASMSVMMPGVFGGEGALSKLLPGFDNALLKGIVQTELGAASEGGEEVLQELFNNLITRSYGSNRELGNLQDYWDVFNETFLSSQLMSAIGGTKEGIQQTQINQIQNEIKKQGELRNTVLEGQALISEDFNDFAQRVEEVPGTTTEELQQVWNNAQQKKQELEQKANNIASNSYNNVATPTYERTQINESENKLSAKESQEYTDILDQMEKDGEITKEQRQRVEKQLGVFTLNNKSSELQQGQMQSESLKPTGLSDITNKTEDNNTNNKKKVKAGVGTRMLQNYNRMNPKRIRKFEAQFKETYGQWMEERGFTKAGESNINDIIDYSKQMQKLKTQIIDKIAGEYRDIAVSDMLSYATERASDTLDRENLKRLQPLLDKYESGKGLTFQEIEKMRKYFSNNINLPYYEDTDAKTAEKNMNVYTALQKYVENIADENGFDKLKEINAEISASESIARGVIEKILGADSNNPLGLTDRITIAGAVSAGSPGAIATVLVKNALKNENVRNAILRVAVGKRDNAKYRGVKIDLDNISKIADEKKRNQAFDEFMRKWKIDSEKLQNTLALPQNTPIAEIGENGPKINKPNTPQPTAKKDIIEINKPQIEKPKPQGLSQLSEKLGVSESKAEQIQESIDDFLNFVGANEEKPTLETTTTADYKQMSTRGLETLLESDKIPIDEVNKINEELSKRDNSDTESWDYLDHKFAYEIQKLQEEEQRIGKVGNRKVNKEYAEKQRSAWVEKREDLVKRMEQAYDKDTNRANEKYGELEGKSLSFINEWTRSKRFAVDEAEQEVISKLQENWNKINRFELMLTAEEQEERAKILDAMKENGYEIRTTEAGDSFYDTKNRDNKGAINWGQQVNATSLETLKNSGLYDMLPDDTKIYISGQEIQTLGELKNNTTNNGLAEMNIDKEAEAQVEGLSDMTRQQKVDTKSKFVDFNDVDMSSKHESFGTDASDNSKQKNPNSAAGVTYYTASKMSDLDGLLRRYGGKGVNSTDFVASYTLGELLDNPALYEKYPGLENKLVVFADFHTNKKRGVNFMDTIYINSKIYEKNPGLARSTIVHEIEHEIQKYEGTYVEKSEAYQNSNRLGEDYVNDPNEQGARKKQQEYLDFIGQGNTKFQKGRGNPITKKQVNQLVKQLKKTGLAKDVKVYETQEEFEQAMDAENARMQSVWHGSPNVFDRFDSSHMGEGEGAQAHGWGHYVAVEERTGRHYAEMKEKASLPYEYNGKLYRDLVIEENTTSDMYERRKLGEITSLIGEMDQSDGSKTFKELLDARKKFINKVLQNDINTLNNKSKGEEQYVIDNLNQFIENDRELLRILDEIDVDKIKKVDLPKNRNLYQVEIPDIVKKNTPTGSNYLEEDKTFTDKDINNFKEYLSKYNLKYTNKWIESGHIKNGEDLYSALGKDFGSDAAVSKFLEKMGYDGIHYFGGRDGEAYVIFNDDALQITNHIQYLKDTNGDIAGAVTPDGTVHLIESNLRGDTATHEFSHLLWSYAKKNNPNLYKALQKIAREAPQELKDYVKRTYGEMSEEAFLDEVFAWRQGKYSGIKTATTWYQRMWEAIKRIWNNVKNSFGSKYANMDVFEAYETMGSEELMNRVDNLLKGGKEIGNTDNQKFREQSVWHGSPYGFDRFDSSHMGEGEGAQAHGWGHYVAVDKETGYGYAKLKDKKAQYKGEGYRQPYSNERKEYGVTSKDLMVDRFLRELDNGEKFDDIMKYYVNDAEFKINDGEQMIATIEREGWDGIDGISIDEVKREIDYWKGELELLNSIKKEDFTQIGHHLYNVEIPDIVKKDTPTRKNYLDEDKVITGPQYERIHKALAEYNPSIKDGYQQNLPYYNWRKTTGYGNGKELYEQISGILGSDKEASKFLESLGYDGIHYFGGTDGEAYVIFNDNALQINDHIQFQKIGGLSNTQIKKFAVQQGLAEISKPQTKEYVVKNGKVGLSNMSIRMQLAEGSFDSYDSMSYENKILSNKSTLQRLADESGVSYKKYEGGYTIDDALKELDDINSNKKGSIKESEIKLAKRDQIKDIIDLINEGLGGEWNYGWFFDTKREYQWTPTILFRKGNDLANEIANKKTIAFHQPKNRKGYEHVPTRRLPISPTRSKKLK